MKTVNIFLFLVLTILSAIVVGLTLSNKFKNREEFVTKVLPPTSEPRCIRSNLDEERMTRKGSRPPCFFNDLDDTNKSLISVNAKIRDRTDDIIRKSTMIDDNLLNRANEGSKKIDLILRSDDLSNFNRHMVNTNTKMADNKNKTTNILKQLNTKNVTIDESSTLNKIQLAVSKMVSQGIDRIISSSSGNMGDLIRKKFKPEHASEIINKLSVLIYDKISSNVFGDVNDMVNELVENNKLDKVIAMSIENAMREDKTYATYMAGGNNNIKIGDFVYFKHRTNSNNADLCIDDPSQREIIIGGKVCNIDPLTNKAKINYLFTTNPNYNKRCSANFSYDKGVSGLPKWYVATGVDQSNKCGPAPFNDGACMPSQWSSDKDAWVRQYVGGFDRNKNEMSCGVGPTASNDYPTEVNIVNLSKSLEDLVNSCQKSKLSYNEPRGIALPKPKYNPSQKVQLPMPKFDELPPPPPPKKSAEQIQREKMQKEAENRIAQEEEAERKALEDLQGAGSPSGAPLNLNRRQAQRMQMEQDQPRPSRPGQRVRDPGVKEPPKGFKVNQDIFKQQAKRDELSLENRCIDSTKDDSKENRYLVDANNNRYRIINGQVMQGPRNSSLKEADKMLPLPNPNTKVLYLFRKEGEGGRGKVLAYGADKKWYQFVRDERDGAQKFMEITKFDMDSDDQLAEIDPNATCVVGNKI
jgi:hypothetical protein